MNAASAEQIAYRNGQRLTALFITKLPAILMAVGVLTTAVFGAINLNRTATIVEKTEAVIEKTDVVHALVNSKFDAQQAEIKAGTEEIAALKRALAAKPGATVEEKIRADVATEESRKQSLKKP